MFISIGERNPRASYSPPGFFTDFSQIQGGPLQISRSLLWAAPKETPSSGESAIRGEASQELFRVIVNGTVLFLMLQMVGMFLLRLDVLDTGCCATFWSPRASSGVLKQ